MPGTSAAPSPTSSFASDIVDAVAVPAALLLDSMDSRPSMPFRLCSMICVTESSTTLAEAPG